MAPLTEIHESLPYIDSEPSGAERSAAEALITAALDTSSSSSIDHPSLPPMYTPSFSPLVEAELARIASKTPLEAIDLSRYEALEPPTTSPSPSADPETLRMWHAALQKAYTSHTYLNGRQINLTMLNQFGKNAWLIGNAQMEDELAALSREMDATKTQLDLCLLERKGAQEAIAGEMQSLGETWRRGIARIVETELAVEGLRGEMDKIRRGQRV